MLRKIPKLILLIWLALIVAVVWSLWSQRWHAALISALTLGLTIIPIRYENRFEIKLPRSFSVIIVVFVFATLFLGEVGDFYERFWWWDIFLHTGSAMAFGMFGFLGVFMMFQGDRFAAPPLAMAFLSLCVAVTIGAAWEIFEFAMDSNFGLNMQKSGLVDTMWDLIVDFLGASIGAGAGYLYLHYHEGNGLLRKGIDAFIEKNKRHFRKSGS